MLDNPKYGGIHNSMGALGIDFNGTEFKRCIAVPKAYPQKEISRVELINMDLTITKRVLFLLSATPFCCVVPGESTVI